MVVRRALCRAAGWRRCRSRPSALAETVGVNPTISKTSPATTQTKDSPRQDAVAPVAVAWDRRSPRAPNGACPTLAPRSPSAKSRNYNGPKVENFAPPPCLFTTVTLKVRAKGCGDISVPRICNQTTGRGRSPPLAGGFNLFIKKLTKGDKREQRGGVARWCGEGHGSSQTF